MGAERSEAPASILYSKLEHYEFKMYSKFGRKLFNLFFRRNPKTPGAGREQFGIYSHTSPNTVVNVEMAAAFLSFTIIAMITFGLTSV